METVCRVCGFDDGDVRWGPGAPEYVICPACWGESGVDDLTVAAARAYRSRWLAAGAPWRDAQEGPPEGWVPQRELERVPPLWR
jgi:hypothetical protein